MILSCKHVKPNKTFNDAYIWFSLKANIEMFQCRNTETRKLLDNNDIM